MLVDRAQMLADFDGLLAIQATTEQALAEVARSYGYRIEEVRAAAIAKFRDLEVYAWKIAMQG